MKEGESMINAMGKKMKLDNGGGGAGEARSNLDRMLRKVSQKR